MTIAWVVGRGGLLGSALARALERSGSVAFVPDEPFAWRDPERLRVQMETACAAFAGAAVDATEWQIHWAAGVGTMMSVDVDLAPETRALGVLLDAMARNRSLIGARGVLSLASSAGAIYAGSREPVISETVPVAPTTAYARAKLEQEAMVTRFAAETRVGALIARISTLYGVGQAKAKAQGLLTHISRSMVRNRPIQIFVPFDTIRDYIAADDAAALLIEAARRHVGSGRVTIKIIASEQPATIGEIVAIFKRVGGRQPRIVTSAAPSTSVYSRRMQFRSIVPPFVSAFPKTSLMVGISRVMAAEFALFVAPSRP